MFWLYLSACYLSDTKHIRPERGSVDKQKQQELDRELYDDGKHWWWAAEDTYDHTADEAGQLRDMRVEITKLTLDLADRGTLL